MSLFSLLTVLLTVVSFAGPGSRSGSYQVFSGYVDPGNDFELSDVEPADPRILDDHPAPTFLASELGTSDLTSTLPTTAIGADEWMRSSVVVGVPSVALAGDVRLDTTTPWGEEDMRDVRLGQVNEPAMAALTKRLRDAAEEDERHLGRHRVHFIVPRAAPSPPTPEPTRTAEPLPAPRQTMSNAEIASILQDWRNAPRRGRTDSLPRNLNSYCNLFVIDGALTNTNCGLGRVAPTR